ncbi:MAG: LAGLIDADG family homing endonuclease [Patescibacteria group bacterium]|jgi:ribonucleotide reductase alpha subunit
MSKLIYLVGDFDSTVNNIVQDKDFDGCGLTAEKVSHTLRSFDGDESAASIFLKKYAIRDNDNKIIEFTLEDAKNRWANAVAEAEFKFDCETVRKPKYFRDLYDYFLPAGRQMLALGNNYLKKATFTNCIVGGSLVLTTNGLSKIKDLTSTDGFNILLENEQYRAIAWSNGVKHVVELKTIEGYSIKITRDHKIQLSDGSWKKIKDLSFGEKIRLNFDDRTFDLDSKDFDRGYASGLFVGDGTFAGEDFLVANIRLFKEKSFLPIQKVAELYGGNILTKENYLSYNSTAWAKDMLFSLGIKHKNKTITEKLFYQTKSYICGFLCGMFDADGSVSNYCDSRGNINRSICLVQSNFNFLQNVQKLLTIFGIKSSIYKHGNGIGKFPKGVYKCKHSWVLRISCESFKKFANIIGFLHPRKKQILKDALSDEFKSDNLFARVKEIVDIGEEEVFDMSVEKVHAFVANGMVVHNCYVTKIEEDSIEGIYDAAKRCARTYSYGGGIGLCIGELRPADSRVSNSAKFSTGAVSFMELYSHTTGLIGQQGRRGALMLTIPITHPDVLNFIEMKHNNEEKVKFANISIKLTDEFMKAVENDEDFVLSFQTSHECIIRTVKARYLWNRIITSARDSGEPGLLFWDRMVEMSPSDSYPRLKVHATNPCVTGDTLVYVADGRGHISIKQLAEENKDVPVFCFDNNKRIIVRTMRNPRITGYKTPVYKITFDDGNSLKATNNHKFLIKGGEYKEVKDLVVGESMHIITKFENSIQLSSGNISCKDYWWLNNGKFASSTTEHKLIAEFFNDKFVEKGYVVHHKDFNTKNNSPQNLEIMNFSEHNKLHTQNMFGDKNPMRRAKTEWSEEKWQQYSKNMSESVSGDINGRFSGITNEELKNHALILTRRLGYRFSNKDWKTYAKKNNVVEQFSKWRNDHFNGLLGLAKWAAIQCGFENIDLDPRSQKFYIDLIEQGYDCIIDNNDIFIIKNCEICGKSYKVHHRCRESGICSKECHSKYMSERNKNSDVAKKAINGMKKYYTNLKKENGEKQVQIFLKLKQVLGRDPKRKELEEECKIQGISYRIGKPSFFNTFEELKESASQYNHKIVSIEFVGYEDVYNGTVDEFHNFFVGGFEGITNKGKKKINYFNSLNCGEQILEPGGACVLGSLLLHKFVVDPFTDKAHFDSDTFIKMTRRGVRHLDNIVELNMGRHPLKEQEEAGKLGRRIGLGVTGLADMFAALKIKYDSDQALSAVDYIMDIKKNTEYEASIYLARERGSFPLYNPEIHFTRGFAATLPERIIEKAKIDGLRNVAISTIAPNGSLSIIAQCSSGAEPIYALHYIRNVMLGKEERKEFSVHHQGIARFFDTVGKQELPNYWVTAHDINDVYRVKLQGLLQKYIDASISSTINLPKDTDAATVGRIYFNAWKEGLKGITVYREGSRKGILITDEYAKTIGIPNMNTSIHCVRAEGGDKFYIMISYEDKDITKPYQVFVMNYKKSDSDSFVKISNSLIKMLKEKGTSEDRIVKYINRSYNSLIKMTRFLSLSMKTGNLSEALKILNEHAFAGTLASKLYDILSKSVLADKASCPNCGSTNLKTEESCISCLDCNWSKCN